MKNNTLEIWIARLFVVFLPFRMLSIFSAITGLAGAQAEHLSFIFHVLGVVGILLRHRGSIHIEITNPGDKLLYRFWNIISVFAVTSLIMAAYVHHEYGLYNGNSPYIAVVKLILDFVQYALIIVYTKEVFELLGEHGVYSCLLLSSRFCMIIGYVQIATLKNLPIISNVYRSIAPFFSWRIYTRQISLTQYEPSWAAMYIGTIVLPLHMARFINTTEKRISIIAEIILWLPVIVMTKSTTAYILAFTALAVAMLRMLFISSSNSGTKTFAIVMLITGIVLINSAEYIDSALGFNFSYLFQQKFTDLGNQSTASRTIPLIGNWEIFKHFPLLGCGNGLQGYFFRTLLPQESYNSLLLDKAVMRLLSGSMESIPNGQLFFPGILSGYGIIGTIIYLKFTIDCYVLVHKHRREYGFFADLFLIAFIPVVISGFKSEFVGNYYIWFILSLPMAFHEKYSEST